MFSNDEWNSYCVHVLGGHFIVPMDSFLLCPKRKLPPHPVLNTHLVRRKARPECKASRTFPQRAPQPFPGRMRSIVGGRIRFLWGSDMVRGSGSVAWKIRVGWREEHGWVHINILITGKISRVALSGCRGRNGRANAVARWSLTLARCYAGARFDLTGLKSETIKVG